MPEYSKSHNEPSSLKNLAHNFIEVNRAASFASANKAGVPHVAIVYCLAKPDLTLYFSTRVEGRKYANLEQRPEVGLAFYNESKLQMIQLSGVARRVDEIELEQEIMHDLMRFRYNDSNWPLPTVQLFERGATNEIAVIEVVPTEMTFADFETEHAGQYHPIFQKIL
jgi:general stress protein 26